MKAEWWIEVDECGWPPDYWYWSLLRRKGNREQKAGLSLISYSTKAGSQKAARKFAAELGIKFKGKKP